MILATLCLCQFTWTKGVQNHADLFCRDLVLEVEHQWMEGWPKRTWKNPVEE